MYQAVMKRYLERGDSAAKTHALLARYFLSVADPSGNHTWTGNNPRAFSELPYHLTKAKMWKELESVLTDIYFIERKSQFGLTYDLVADYAEACNDVNTPLWPSSTSLQKVKELKLVFYLNEPQGHRREFSSKRRSLNYIRMADINGRKISMELLSLSMLS